MNVTIIKQFPRCNSEAAALRYLEGVRWGGKPTCPVCSGHERISKRRDGFYRCTSCQEDFTVRTGTVMERSHVPLTIWLRATNLLADEQAHTAKELSDLFGVTAKTARKLIWRIEKACWIGIWFDIHGLYQYQPPATTQAGKRRRRKALAAS